MMLVSQVALGTTLDVHKHQWDLTAPPSGYHSVHGVAATEGVESDFQVSRFFSGHYFGEMKFSGQ